MVSRFYKEHWQEANKWLLENAPDYVLKCHEEYRNIADKMFNVSAQFSSRWFRLDKCSPSGKMMFVCLCCGRTSTTPDKYCKSFLDPVEKFKCSEWIERNNFSKQKEKERNKP